MSGTGLLPTEKAIARVNALSKMQPTVTAYGTGLLPAKEFYKNTLSLSPTTQYLASRGEKLMGLPPTTIKGGRRRRSAKQRKARKTRKSKTRRSRK